MIPKFAELTCAPEALHNLRETLEREGYREDDCRVDIDVLGGSVDHLDLASSRELWRGHYARRVTPLGAWWHMLSLPMNMFELRARVG